MKRIALPFALLLACCSGQSKPTLGQALRATVAATNVTYGLAVELCDRKEREIVERAPTTLEQDKADLAHVREVCDKLFNVFENARQLHLLVAELEAL